MRVLGLLTSGQARKKSAPRVVKHRVEGKKAAVVFIHGFSGRSDETWQQMIEILLSDPNVRSWDVFSVGYASSLRVDILNFWAADPSINMLASGLATSLALEPFSSYGSIAIVAHSMGGLVAQRAICDTNGLRDKLSHLVLYGTPSKGLLKATYLGPLKQQLRDMAEDSKFIRKLRKDWDGQFDVSRPFELNVVAGDRDEFVNGNSSLGPFSDDVQMVVPGDHLSMIRPKTIEDEIYSILGGALSGKRKSQTYVDGAEVALEMREFHKVIGTLWNNRKKLDDNALVTLALALESVGRRDDAIAVLESRDASSASSDVKGTLAGRLKRRWLAGRVQEDFERAKGLYVEGLNEAESNGDHSQAYYHAVNVAFLELMILPPGSDISDNIQELAKKVIEHCNTSKDSVWRRAALGEAKLMLSDLSGAKEDYAAALELASPRENESFSCQAVKVAARVFGADGARQIADCLGYRD